MRYRQITYDSILGRTNIIELGDFSYGEWIIYVNDAPAYHINVFDPVSPTNVKIRSLLEAGTSIEQILDDINRKENSNLYLKKRPIFSIERGSKLIELNLAPMPDYLLKNI